MRENDARKALDDALAALAKCRTAHAETMRALDEVVQERDYAREVARERLLAENERNDLRDRLARARAALDGRA